MTDDLLRRGAADLARLVRSGEVSAVEVVDAFVARNEALHPALNGLVVPCFDEAKRTARTADAARARGDELGPLFGVPITIKEQFAVRGTPTTLGLPSRKGILDTAEGPLVTRLRNAGAIILGKTNVSQFLMYLEADNPVYGRTQNPWNLDRTCGGSSGGEAAIVAARGSALGLGGDLGGSIRIPAHFCGVHGLKPTPGRLTNADSLRDSALTQEGLIAQPGPIARRVEDLTLAMEVLVASSTSTAGVPPVPWVAPPANVAGLRVGWFDGDETLPAAPGLRRVVREAAEALARAGAHVEEWRPPSVSDAMPLYVGMITSDRFGKLRRLGAADPIDRRVGGLFTLASLPSGLLSVAAVLVELAGQRRLARSLRAAQARTAAQYFAVLGERNAFREAFTAAMDAAKLDVLLCPPCAVPAFHHGASEFLFESASPTVLFNVLGFPGGVVAAGRVRAGEESDRPESRDPVEKIAKKVETGSAGLPIGVHVAAQPWREDLVLATMRALEEHFEATDDYPVIERSQAPILRQ